MLNLLHYLAYFSKKALREICVMLTVCMSVGLYVAVGTVVYKDSVLVPRNIGLFVDN